MSRNKIWVFVIILVIISILSWNKMGVKDANNEIHVGAILSLSSYGASDGQSIKNGLLLAKEDLVKDGFNLSIEYQDDKSEGKDAASATQYFASKKVDLLVGPQWSYLMQASLPIINSTKIPTIAPSLTTEVVNMPSEYILYGMTKNEHKTMPVVDWIQKNNIKHPAIFANNISWGENHISVFKNAAKKAGVSESMTERIAFGSEADTIPSLVLKAKNNGSDAVMWSGSNNGVIIIAHEMNKLGLNVPLLVDESVTPIIGTEQIERTEKGLYTFTWNTPKEFVDKYNERFGKKPDHYAIQAYDMLTMAIHTTKMTENGNLIQKVRSGDAYKGYAGEYKFDENGDVVGGEWRIEKVQ